MLKRKSSIYFVYKSLVNALNLIKSKKLNADQLASFCNHEIKLLVERLPPEYRFNGAINSDVVLKNIDNSEYLDQVVQLLEKSIAQMNLIEPEIIFLLTAPFDEEAKTGDGQYAHSLVEGFGQHSKSSCIWLKEKRHSDPGIEHVHYNIGIENDLKPIPANTIPTVYVLQQVANEKTVLSGYQLGIKSDFNKAQQKIKNQVTIRTPKILTNAENKIVVLGVYLDGEVQLFNKESLASELSSIETKLKQSNSNLLTTRYNHLEKVLNQFHPNPYNELELVDSLKGLSSESIPGVQKISLKKDFALIFKQVYQIAQDDIDRKVVIRQIISQIRQNGLGKKCAIDIHIRTPDTGAFITPKDILKFKKMGLVVNITVHEYKQNYTRPHLQLLTHELLKRASSVLFFNSKELKNAVKAADSGQIDSKRKDNWPCEKYNLLKKSGLTVASQVLSGANNVLPEDVLKKAPNLLCFGTIRPNKGFDVAIELAKLIKQSIVSQEPMICEPTVIIGGDPQDTGLMEAICKERFGESVFKEYQLKNSYGFDDTSLHSPQMKRDYWIKAIATLNENETQLHNPYLKIIPWIDDLEVFKTQGKYFLRFDDMGMRNNGSGIISVLNGGIVYTKWGTVTDEEYQPNGRHAQAILLTPKKYGKYNKDQSIARYENEIKVKSLLGFQNFYSSYNNGKKIESNYKRKEDFVEPHTVLKVILDRERDQLLHATNITYSQNYQTVMAAQMLLQTKFSLENSVLCLTKAILPKMQETTAIEKAKKVENTAKDQEHVTTIMQRLVFFDAAPKEVSEAVNCNDTGFAGDNSTGFNLSQNGVV